MLNKIGDIFLLLNIALRSKLAALLVMVNLPLVSICITRRITRG